MHNPPHETKLPSIRLACFPGCTFKARTGLSHRGSYLSNGVSVRRGIRRECTWQRLWDSFPCRSPLCQLQSCEYDLRGARTRSVFGKWDDNWSRSAKASGPACRNAQPSNSAKFNPNSTNSTQRNLAHCPGSCKKFRKLQPVLP